MDGNTPDETKVRRAVEYVLFHRYAIREVDVGLDAWVLQTEPVDPIMDKEITQGCACFYSQFTPCDVGLAIDFRHSLVETIQRVTRIGDEPRPGRGDPQMPRIAFEKEDT
jgi:hypothetical protein